MRPARTRRTAMSDGSAASNRQPSGPPFKVRRIMAPRTILYTGKGGVGKTSVAAATARSCAAAGLRTIVLSTDPAHSLSDSLCAPLGADPTPIAERLYGQEVQAQREMEVHWGAVQRWL